MPFNRPRQVKDLSDRAAVAVAVASRLPCLTQLQLGVADRRFAHAHQLVDPGGLGAQVDRYDDTDGFDGQACKALAGHGLLVARKGIASSARLVASAAAKVAIGIGRGAAGAVAHAVKSVGFEVEHNRKIVSVLLGSGLDDGLLADIGLEAVDLGDVGKGRLRDLHLHTTDTQDFEGALALHDLGCVHHAGGREGVGASVLEEAQYRRILGLAGLFTQARNQGIEVFEPTTEFEDLLAGLIGAGK